MIGPAPIKPPLKLSEPSAGRPVGTTLPSAEPVANARVGVVAGAQPGGAANFSGDTVAGPYGNFTVNVILKLLSVSRR